MKKFTSYLFPALLALVLSACQINNAPTNPKAGVRAVIQASVTEGVAPLAVTFDASASQGITFAWSFGGNTDAQGKTVSHTFTRAGSFNVQLTVTDNRGNTDSKSVAITVRNADGSVPTNPNPSNPANPNNPTTGVVPVSAGVVLPIRRAQMQEEVAQLGLFTVIEINKGRVGSTPDLTGTATLDANGRFTNFNKQNPTDRLRVVFSNGATLEYIFTGLRGDFNQPNVKAFFRKPHTVAFRFITQTGTDINVLLNNNGRSFTNSVTGKIVDAGITYDVDTTSSGETNSSLDTSSIDFRSRETITGTITAPGFSLTLNEGFQYRLIVFENAVEDITRTFNNTWTIGNDTYTLTDATIFRTFKEAAPVELDSWRAIGQITRNGQVVGGLSFEQNVSSIDTVLIVDGAKTVLFSDRTINP